jgi:hypothetical protein
LEADFGIALFCYYCGNRLNQDYQSQKETDENTSLTSRKAIFQDILPSEPYNNNVPLIKDTNSIYNLGIQLEEVVE